MSTKTKASSKSKKATPKGTKKVITKKSAVKKPAVKTSAKKMKPVKKSTVKPAAKKVVAKKVTAKKIVAKKPVKKTVKPTTKANKKIVAKKAAPKKAVAKKITKKVVKPIAKAVKKLAKKVAKPVIKKPIINKTKQTVAKPADKKINKLPVTKPLEVKVPDTKPEKITKGKTEKKPLVKKTIVAPTTYRKEEIAPTKLVKEPAGKFEMEFVIRASEDMVYEFISTESGLSEWFCDDVNIRNGIFTFTWEGQEQQAKLVKEMPPVFIRYQWLDKNDGSYFEFRTQKDELTNDISLIITDFASDKADEESARLLWSSQIDKLLHVLGSFF